MKLRKSLFAAAFSGILLLTPVTAHAQVYQEANSNETIDQAQDIVRDNKTVYQYATGDNSQAYIIDGYLDNVEDADWFKIDLNANQNNYLVFSHYNSSTNASIVEICNDQGNVISGNSYRAVGGGGVNVMINTPYTGTYYVKVYSSTWNGKLNYRMSIGEPICEIESYTYKFGTITLGPSNSNWSGSADLSKEKLPVNAIVRKVSLLGVGPSAYKSMAYRNEFISWRNITLSGYSTPCTQEYKLTQTWQIKYVGNNRDKKVTPSLTLYYTYPLSMENKAFWK